MHVFDASGKRLHVCRPTARDFDGDLSLPSLTVNDAGEVFLASGESTDFVRFAADGARVGRERVPVDEYSQAWYAQPGTGRTWIVGYAGLFLVEGERVVRSLARAPDGSWLRELGSAAVAADGSLALLSGDLEGGPVSLHLYSTAGDPLRTLRLPEGVKRWASCAFDGAHLAVAVQAPRSDADELLLLDLAPERVRRMALGTAGKRWTPAFAAGGRELWLFDGQRRVERYAME